ncbi:hypothetical protein NMY22_g3607 [Coprinellus aureogranulatus]|nr:hypothetical protein NMY22_g3607 [Coprinellus aureogranulatus]
MWMREGAERMGKREGIKSGKRKADLKAGTSATEQRTHPLTTLALSSSSTPRGFDTPKHHDPFEWMRLQDAVIPHVPGGPRRSPPQALAHRDLPKQEDKESGDKAEPSKQSRVTQIPSTLITASNTDSSEHHMVSDWERVPPLAKTGRNTNSLTVQGKEEGREKRDATHTILSPSALSTSHDVVDCNPLQRLRISQREDGQPPAIGTLIFFAEVHYPGARLLVSQSRALQKTGRTKLLHRLLVSREKVPLRHYHASTEGRWDLGLATGQCCGCLGVQHEIRGGDGGQRIHEQDRRSGYPVPIEDWRRDPPTASVGKAFELRSPSKESGYAGPKQGACSEPRSALRDQHRDRTDTAASLMAPDQPPGRSSSIPIAKLDAGTMPPPGTSCAPPTANVLTYWSIGVSTLDWHGSKPVATSKAVPSFLAHLILLDTVLMISRWSTASSITTKVTSTLLSHLSFESPPSKSLSSLLLASPPLRGVYSGALCRERVPRQNAVQRLVDCAILERRPTGYELCALTASQRSRPKRLLVFPDLGSQ